MKKVIIGIVVIVIAAFVVAILAIVSPNPSTPEAPGVTSLYFTYDLYPDEPGAEMSIEYPQLSGWSSSTVQTFIDSDVAVSAKVSFDEISSDLEKSKRVSSAGADSLFYTEKVVKDPSVLAPYIDVDRKIFSYATVASGDFGGAHPSGGYRGYDYSLSTGKQISLSDIAAKGQEDKIRSYIKLQIEGKSDTCIHCENLLSQNGKFEMPFGGVIPLSSFKVSADGLWFMYSDYELGPYAATAGGQAIFVPWTAFAQVHLFKNVK